MSRPVRGKPDKVRLLVAVLLSFVLAREAWCDVSMQASSPATFSLLTQRDVFLTLRDPVRFRAGDDQRWRDPGLDDSSWQLTRIDRNWKAVGLNDLHGMAWYRFNVLLPRVDEPYSLRLPAIRTAYELYLNGEILYASGRMPPYGVMYATVPAVIAVPPRASRPLHFALRVWQDPVWCAYRPGGPQGAIFIGRSSLIEDRYLNERLARLWKNSDWFDLTALELFAGIAALTLFLVGRSEREYLWFCLLALGSSLNHGLELWARLHAHPVHPVESLQSICFTGYLAASLMFYRTLLAGKKNFIFRIMLVCCALWFANAQTALIPNFPASAENIGELIFELPIYSWILALLFARALRRWPDARLLAVPVTFLVGTAFLHAACVHHQYLRPSGGDALLPNPARFFLCRFEGSCRGRLSPSHAVHPGLSLRSHSPSE